MAGGASFEDLPITERAREAAHALGWRQPTPIQQAVVPQLVMGRDVIGRAQTGSGKTGAFGLVLTDAVKAPGLQALVLVPTRELAVQVAADLNALARAAPFQAVAVHGGVPFDGQLAQLREPDATCIVATTGRLLDLLARQLVDLKDVRWIILDEADRMLDLGFLPEVERVLKQVPGARQTALFTATMPRKVSLLAHRYMAHARDIEVGAQTPASATHHRIDVASFAKFDALLSLFEKEKPKRALLFTRTRNDAQRLARMLVSVGMPAVGLHGDLDQSQREAVIGQLREGELTIVVATDVAARGLDLPGLTHVINYDVPEDADTYVHRAGRTARAGKKGRVFTFVTENDGAHADAAERSAHVKLRSYIVPLPEGRGGLTRPEPLPPKMHMRGGYARGAQRKKPPTPPRKAALPEDAAHVAREPEHDLPPSRRRHGADDDAN